VLNTLAEVCHAKSIHLRGNWQDENTARVWSKAGNNISTLANYIDL
jgi:hypothetical protein